MADPMKPVRDGVLQEPSDELIDGERHDLGLVVMAVVFPGETNLTIEHVDQSAVGNGDTMGVAAEIREYLLGTGKWSLGVDDPFQPAQRGERWANLLGTASSASVPEKRSAPLSNACCSRCRKR